MPRSNHNGKRFLLVFGLTTTLLTALLPAFNFWLDGSRVFTRENTLYVGVEPNYRFASVRGVLALEAPPRVVIFGSSRVNNGFDISAYPDHYKLTYPAASVHEHVESLQALVANGRAPAEAWLAIDPDVNAYRTRATIEQFSNTITYPSSLREWTHLYHKVLFKRASTAELELARLRLRGQAELIPMAHYANQLEGSNIQPGPKHANKLLALPPFHPRDFKPEYFYEQLAAEVREFAAVCAAAGSRCVLFITPRFYKTWLDQDFEQQARFKELLVGVAPFYDFEGLHMLNLEPQYWSETNHFVSAVGERVRARIAAEGDTTYGTLVTAQNLHAHLAELRASAQRELRVLLEYDQHIIVHPSLRSSLSEAPADEFSAHGWTSTAALTSADGPAWLRLTGGEPLVGEGALLRIELDAPASATLQVQAPLGERALRWKRLYERKLDLGRNVFFVPLDQGALRAGVRVTLDAAASGVQFSAFEYWGVTQPQD
jgi:hypothetical protein